MRLLRHILFIATILFVSNGYAQPPTAQAYQYYKANDFENAKILIDSAITTDERFDSQTWQLRGIIYRNLSNEEQLYFRDISVESFVRAKSLDTAGIYTPKINEYLRNTVILYYNDAVNLLKEEKECQKSEEAYIIYKTKYQTLVDPNHNFNETDVNFYNALGAEYLVKVDLVPDEKKDFQREKALESCAKVLQIDSLNFQANLNSGIVYYNLGADLIMNQDPFISLEGLIESQQRSEAAFLKALPYLHRAEKIDPTNEKVIEGLMGSYYGLNNNEQYLKYQKILDTASIDWLLQQHEQNPKDEEILKRLVRIYSTTLKDETKREYYKRLLDELRNK